MTFNDFMWQVCFLGNAHPQIISSISPSIDTRQAATHIHATWGLYHSVYIVSAHHGGHFALHVCRCDQGSKGLGWVLAHGNQYGWVLESHHRMVEGEIAP